MQKTIYLTHLTILLFFIGTSNSETVTADIIQGYSWEYSVSYSEGNGIEKSSGSTTINIDSVWNDSSDTLFFRISRFDSIYSEVKDSTYINSVQIYVRKINGELISNDSLINTMFNKYDYRQYDTSYDYTFFQHFIGTTVYHNETLRTFKYSSRDDFAGLHMYENLEITDKIGMTYWAFGRGASIYPTSHVYTLKMYCGKELTTTTCVKKNVVNATKTSNTAFLKFYKTISCNNTNLGVTLLGRTGAWKNGSFGIILIQKRKTN